MGKVDIWMPLYINDYLGDTQHLSTEEHGVYFLLMMHYWKRGALSGDVSRLLSITKLGSDDTMTLMGILEEFFSYESIEDKWYHSRIDKEIGNASARRSSAQNNGRLGGRPKGSIKPESKTRMAAVDWAEMLEVFGNKCLCCGAVFVEGTRPTRDHIVPKSKGGSDDISNLQPLCRECNAAKYNQHETDFRTDYLDIIPEKLKLKWCIEKPGGFFSHPKMGINKNPEGTPQKSSSPSPSPSPIHTSSQSKKGGEGKTVKRFVPPAPAEVYEYGKEFCREQNFPGFKPATGDMFLDHFSSNGWKVGGKAVMKDWKASLRNWIRRDAPESTLVSAGAVDRDRQRQLNRQKITNEKDPEYAPAVMDAVIAGIKEQRMDK